MSVYNNFNYTVYNKKFTIFGSGTDLPYKKFVI